MRRERYLIWGLLLTVVPLLASQEPGSTKAYYGIKEAVATYTIEAHGPLSNDLNYTLRGEERRCFAQWGEREYIHLELQEQTEGLFGYQTSYEEISERDGEKHYRVDLKKEKILIHKEHQKRPKHLDGHWRDLGLQMVGNVVCSMKENGPRRLCLYKGIVVFERISFLGITYTKTLDELVEKYPFKDTSCHLPLYPIEPFALYHNPLKTIEKENQYLIWQRWKKSLSLLEKSQKSLEKIPPKAKKEIMTLITKPIFTTEKERLFKRLELLKMAQLCLSTAESEETRQECIATLQNEDKEAASELLEDVIPQKPLEHVVDDAIFALASKMKCIRAATSLDDLTGCMQP